MSKEQFSLSLSQFKTYLQDGASILDCRKPTTFTQGYIPNSINIGNGGAFEEWAGVLIPKMQPILLVCEYGEEESMIELMKKNEYTNVLGYLQGGFETWQNANENIDLIIDVEADELKMDMNYDKRLVILDVRTENEYNLGHVQSAVNMPLSQFVDSTILAGFEENDNIYIHCAGGYRSVIAASIFKKEGYHNIRNVLGGYKSIKE